MPSALPGSALRLAVLGRYLGLSAAGHLAWEVVQLPLYTIWTTGSVQENAFAVAHCTVGDILIATSTLVVALLLLGNRNWPAERFGRVLGAALAFGVAYTIYSEWLNTTVRASWAYSPLMPIVPVIGTGLSPLLQWVVVPLLAMQLAVGRRIGSRSR